MFANIVAQHQPYIRKPAAADVCVFDPYASAGPTYDPYWNSVVLMLHLDGTNGSTTFTDSSAAAEVLTATGGAAISTAQSKWGGASLALNGTTDYIQADAASANYDFAGGDYTVEAWVYSTEAGRRQTIITNRPVASTRGFELYKDTSDRLVFVRYDSVGSAASMNSGSLTIPTNQWVHVAVTRQSRGAANMQRLFVNGRTEGFLSDTTSIGTSAGLLNIGRDPSAAGREWAGYIDEVRITKGVGRYWGGYTVPEAAFPDQLETVWDPESPRTVLSLHAEDFTDSSGYNAKTITPGGVTEVSAAQWRFGERSFLIPNAGTSTANGLTVSAHQDLILFAGDWTLEMWLRRTANTYAGRIFTGLDTSSMYALVTTGGMLDVVYNTSGGTQTRTGIASIPTNTWVFLTIQRRSNFFEVYIDGVRVDNVAVTGGSTSTMDDVDLAFFIGRETTNSTTTFNGYIDEVRLTKGVARYTADFNRPSLPNCDPTPLVPPDPPPPPAPSPQPLPPEPIAFSAVIRRSLFGVVGTPISSTTLATITCADASMTIALSHTVPGLTFSYAGNVLSVAGTPTGPTSLTRVVVSYIASDGSNSVRGSTEHEITIVDASEVLTIGSMAGASGRVGVPLTATLASPSTNYEVNVRITPNSSVPGLTPALSWTVGSGSASGSLTISGTPTTAGTYSLEVDYFGFGVNIGTSTHSIVIAAAYQPPAPAPSPTPAPPAPSPSPPPAPTPAPAPSHGPDPVLTTTRVLMRFNRSTGIAYDERGNTFTSSGPTFSVGAVADGARFASSSDQISGTVPTLLIEDAADEHLTVEAMVKPNDNALWVAVFADGVRYMPVVSCLEPDGSLVWTMGYVSLIDDSTPENPGRNVHPCFIVTTQGTTLEVNGVTLLNYRQMALGRVLPSKPGQFMHLAGMLEHAAPAKLACWIDGRGNFGGRCANFSGTLRRPSASAVIRIGSAFVPNPGSVIDPAGALVQIRTMVRAQFDIDELRIKQDDHYGAFVTGTNTQADIPAASRVIPWPNY